MLLVWVLAGSVVFIAAMVMLNAWLGLSEPAHLASLDDAVRRLDDDSIGFAAGEGVVAPDGRSALVEAGEGGRIGLIIARGSDFVIRYLDPGAVRRVAVSDAGGIVVALNDFAFAPARLDLGSAETARHWAGKLQALQG